MSRYGLEIRAADASDAGGIAELLEAAGRVLSAAQATRRLAQLHAGGATVLLALEWGPPSGLVTLRVEPTLERDTPDARISALVVAPDARRRGIGRLLLKAAAQRARTAGCGDLRLEVELEDESSAAFCRDSGFTLAAHDWVRPLRKGG